MACGITKATGAITVVSESLEFRLLRYIVAVAETANITRAAERLFLAQPSLSKQIRDLEGDLKFPIFERTRDGMKVTPAGEMVVAYAREALKGRDELVEMARAVHQGAIPPLRLGFSAFIDDHLLQSFRSTYCGLFPNCQLQLAGGETTQNLQRISRRQLDCAIALLPIDDDLFHVQQISQTPLGVCMRSDDPLSVQSRVDIHEVAHRVSVFADPELHPGTHARLARSFEEAGVPLTVAHSAITPAQVQWMVRAGYGLALINQTSVLTPGLTVRPIQGADWTIDAAFVYQNRADHIALPFIERSLSQSWRNSKRKKHPTDSEAHGQLELLA